MSTKQSHISSISGSDLLYKFAVGLFQRVHFCLEVSDGAAEVPIQLLDVVLLIQYGCHL